MMLSENFKKIPIKLMIF